MSHFFFLDSGYNSAHYNMALDEYLLQAEHGLFLRVYGWSIPAISIGFGQSAVQELDLIKLRRDHLQYVRRLTGGRAVLHAAEVTYSVSADIGGLFGENLNSAFQIISLGLRETLSCLGVECELEKGSVRDSREKTTASLPCFASTARHELKVNGRKIIGSAQRREKKRFLQHGSFILSNQIDITEYLKLDDEGRNKYRQILEKEATSLEEVGVKSCDYSQIRAAFKEGFQKAWGIQARDYQFPEKSCDAIRQLEAKYFSDEWNRVF